MKFLALLLTFALLATPGVAQTKKPSPAKPQPQKASKTKTPVKKIPAASSTLAARKPLAKKAPTADPKPTPEPKRDEKTEFEAASAAEPLEKVNALKKFIVDFPTSEYAGKAKEMLVVARAVVADERLRGNDAAASVALFKLAVEEAPDPMPDRLFTEVISKFPYSLYWNGQRPAAIEVAAAIESRAASNVAQLVAVANFYASTENGAEAMRIAEAALKLDPNSSPAYQTIGLAHRLNFDLEKSAAAYAKALELDPASMNSKQSLAEMDRALGKPEEAEKLYREMLAIAPDDIPAQTGLVLSLFDAGKAVDAEAEMAKALETNPKNVILLAGAAYSYAANGAADKAIELAEKAIELEPRYIWSHIALARGYMGKQRPVDAERVLTRARAYGNFPTVEYELASARIAAGFYREAAEDLQKTFSIADGNITTKLGGRVERTASGFAELAAAERRASIFTPTGAVDAERDLKLKQLLELHQKISTAEPDTARVGTLVDEFTSGSGPMKVHRQLYAASVLLQKNIDHEKVLELARAATGNTDAGLDAPNAAAAVMASELYDSRSLAFARGEFLLVPDVPRQTLSMILRGRVEETAGWALYQQSNYPEAIVRLRRAVSVLRDKSAWWRSSTWRLGAALAASGKDKDALDAYIASYKTDKPDLAKYFVVESLYKRVNNGSIEGLEAQIGKERVVTVAGNIESAAAPNAAEAEAPAAQAMEEIAPAATPAPIAADPEPVRLPRGVPVDPASKVTPIGEIPAEPSQPAAESKIVEEPSEPKKGEVVEIAPTEPENPKGDVIEPPAESKPVVPTTPTEPPPDESKPIATEPTVDVPVATPLTEPEKKEDPPPVVDKPAEPAVVTVETEPPVETKPVDLPAQAESEKPTSEPPSEVEKPRTEEPPTVEPKKPETDEVPPSVTVEETREVPVKEPDVAAVPAGVPADTEHQPAAMDL